jgi:hypothetical protein
MKRALLRSHEQTEINEAQNIETGWCFLGDMPHYSAAPSRMFVVREPANYGANDGALVLRQNEFDDVCSEPV